MKVDRLNDLGRRTPARGRQTKRNRITVVFLADVLLRNNCYAKPVEGFFWFAVGKYTSILSLDATNRHVASAR